MTSSYDASSTATSSTAPRTTSSTSPDGPGPAPSGRLVVLAAEDVVVVDERTTERHGAAQRVTSARGSHADDVARRMRTYAISMGVRTACVLAAVLSFPHWWAWLFVPGAVVLPYVAVVLANVGGERAPAAVSPAGPPRAAALPAA